MIVGTVKVQDIEERSIDFTIDSDYNLAIKVARAISDKYKTDIDHWDGTQERLRCYLTKPLTVEPNHEDEVYITAIECAAMINRDATEQPTTFFKDDAELVSVGIPARMYVGQTIRVKTDNGWLILKRVE